MKVIKLTRGYETVVDDDDYTRLMAVATRWTVTGTDKRGIYARSYHVGYLHVYLMSPKPGQSVDHIDRNTLNNLRSNLRCVSRSRNMHNSIRKMPYGYPGVQRINGTFCSRIGVDHKRTWLGLFKTKKEAARAYRKAYLAAIGEEHHFYR